MEDYKSSSTQQININVLLLNVLSEIKKNNDNSFILAEFKTNLDAIFLDLNQSNYLFECINQLIFNNDKSFQSKNFNEEPVILYQIIFELNKTLSFPYIKYYLETLKEMLPLIENIIFVKNSFIEFIYIFFEDVNLPEDKKQELLQRLINFCTETMEMNSPKVKMHGSYLYGLLIEKYPLIFKDAQISNLWKIISNFYGDKKFSNKLYLLYCNIILIYKTKEKFKPYSNLCLFKILDYLTDKDWLKRKMAIQVINSLLIYCRDDILTIKDNIVGFLSVVKEDSVPQVRDICLQTLNSIENKNIQPKINMNLISGLKYGFDFDKSESQNTSVLEGIKEVDNEKEYESTNIKKNTKNYDINSKDKNNISNQPLTSKKRNFNKSNNKKHYDKSKNNGSNLKHRSASTRHLSMKFLGNEKQGNSKKAIKSIHGSFCEDENSGRNKKNNYNNTFAYINTTNTSQKRNKEESQSATTKKNKKFIRIDSTEELRKKLEKEKLFLEQIEKQINERKNNDEIKKLNNQKSFNEIMLPSSSKQNLNDYINKSNRNNISKTNLTGNKNNNYDINNSFNKINNTTKNSNNSSKNKSNSTIKNLKKEENIVNQINNKKQFKPKSLPNESSNNNTDNNNNSNIEKNNLNNNINNNLNIDNNIIENILSQLEKLNKSQEDVINQLNYMNNKIDTNYKNLDDRLKVVEKTLLITKKIPKNEMNKSKIITEEDKKFEEIKNNFLNGNYTSAIMDSIENDKFLYKLLPLITADIINNGIDANIIEDLISRVSLKLPRFTSSDKTYVSNILSFFNQIANSGIDLKLITKLNLKDALKYIKSNYGLRLTQKDNSYIDNVLKTF